MGGSEHGVRTRRRRVRAIGGVASAMLVAAVAAVSVVGNTDVSAPPRFDGAGYAVLGEALATGRGYREIDRPDAPRHAHFPPGYPAALALLWRITGRSTIAAHRFSEICTIAAAVAAWCWFRRLYPRRTALLLGLALAANWTWGRAGGGIQSEPLYFLLGQSALLATAWAARRGGSGAGAVPGALLAACVLTRHVGVCLAAVVGIELLLRRRGWAALACGLVAVLLLVPWAAWLVAVGHGTQAGLLAQGGLAARVASQAVFYVQRLPDQVTGPVVEIGTVFRKSAPLSAAANVWAIAATAVLVFGWARTLRDPRRRLAGLVPFTTLPLLLVWPFTEAGRFLIPLVPFLLVGAVEGLVPLARGLGRRRPRAWAAGAVLFATLPYAGYALATGRAEAQRRTYADFDAACAWLREHSDPPGPVLSRHPGEVYWQSGRHSLSVEGDDADAAARAVERYGVAFLLVDDDRFAYAPATALNRFVTRYPERVGRVWGRESSRAAVSVYRVLPVERPAPSNRSTP